MKNTQKLIWALQISLAWGCISAELNPPQRERPTDSETPSARERDLFFQNNENRAAIVDLAVERFNHDKKNGENCILTLTDDVEVAKYSDGKLTLIALPLDLGTNYTGIERFVHTYNHMVIRDADVRLKSGQLDRAELTFKLLLKHDPSNGYTNELRKRLEIISKARVNKDLAALAMEIEKLEPNNDLFSFYGDMGTKPPTMVPDLLKVEVNDLVTPRAGKTNTIGK